MQAWQFMYELRRIDAANTRLGNAMHAANTSPGPEAKGDAAKMAARQALHESWSVLFAPRWREFFELAENAKHAAADSEINPDAAAELGNYGAELQGHYNGWRSLMQQQGGPVLPPYLAVDPDPPASKADAEKKQGCAWNDLSCHIKAAGDTLSKAALLVGAGLAAYLILTSRR